MVVNYSQLTAMSSEGASGAWFTLEYEDWRWMSYSDHKSWCAGRDIDSSEARSRWVSLASSNQTIKRLVTPARPGLAEEMLICVASGVQVKRVQAGGQAPGSALLPILMSAAARADALDAQRQMSDERVIQDRAPVHTPVPVSSPVGPSGSRACDRALVPAEQRRNVRPRLSVSPSASAAAGQMMQSLAQQVDQQDWRELDLEDDSQT